jgi:lysozyme
MRVLVVVVLVALALCAAEAQDFPTDPSHLTSLAQEEALDGTSLGAADTGPPPFLLPLALDLIKDFEGWKPRAYNDAHIYCTIGYGHLIVQKPCANSATELMQFVQPLDKGIGLKLLDKDTAIARFDVKNLVQVPLSDEQFGALASFVFNIGGANFETSTMLKYINYCEFNSVPTEFGKWIMSKGQILDGLITRRACEASLFMGTLAYGRDGQFHREDCGSLGAAPSTESLIDIEIGEKR